MGRWLAGLVVMAAAAWVMSGTGGCRRSEPKTIQQVNAEGEQRGAAWAHAQQHGAGDSREQAKQSAADAADAAAREKAAEKARAQQEADEAGRQQAQTTADKVGSDDDSGDSSGGDQVRRRGGRGR